LIEFAFLSISSDDRVRRNWEDDRVKDVTGREIEPDDRVSMRSTGVQVRSRERVEQILKAAEAIVAEGGMDGLKMRELARRAGLPIASLYHYFPSSSSVVRALALRHLETIRTVLDTELQALMQEKTPLAQRPQSGGIIVRRLLSYLLASSASAFIWDSLRSSPDLRQLDMEDTVRNARELEPYLRWVAPNLCDRTIPGLMMVLLEAVQANLILIMHSPPDTQPALIDALAEMFTATLRGLQTTDRTD
jgi:AcrR family transcriptional regulator